MRDLDRWKDKVEISLDGRQIFFLFFGSAVAACLIFVVGVLIGKRIEARALAMQPAAIEDPLAALDQLGDADEADEGLTFHKALAPAKPDKLSPARPEKADKAEKSEKIEKAAEAKKEPAAKPAEKKPATATANGGAANGGAVNGATGVGGNGATLAANDDEDSDDKAPEPKRPEPKKPDAKAATLPAARPQVVAATAGAGGAGQGGGANGAAAKKLDATASHFTLQLSAFPDKSDAEEFMHKIQSAGYKPFLVASEIPGKGVFFRVRVGDYGSRQAAVDAKSEFERKQRIIAYVAKL